MNANLIGNRPANFLLPALFDRRHYRAVFNMMRLLPNFAQDFRRYLKTSGDYPYDIKVRTPVGDISIKLWSYHDLLTVNEIFCRKDYGSHSSIRSVLDIGANIGISALYFLTRNKDVRCVLYEPNPRNCERLKENLKGYEDRYVLHPFAVSDTAGELSFGIEETGRYGGIGIDPGIGRITASIIVSVLHINDVLRQFFKDDGTNLDILKIDTEGVEIQTIEAANSVYLERIKAIFVEAKPDHKLHPGLFSNSQYGAVRRLKLRKRA